MENVVLCRFGAAPSISTRAVTANIYVCQSTVCRIIREEGMQSFFVQRIQSLNINGCPHHLDFWGGFQMKSNFPDLVLFKDKASFTRKGIFNARKKHMLFREQSPLNFPTCIAAQMFFDVLGGIVGDWLVVPCQIFWQGYAIECCRKFFLVYCILSLSPQSQKYILKIQYFWNVGEMGGDFIPLKKFKPIKEMKYNTSSKAEMECRIFSELSSMRTKEYSKLFKKNLTSEMHRVTLWSRNIQRRIYKIVIDSTFLWLEKNKFSWE